MVAGGRPRRPFGRCTISGAAERSSGGRRRTPCAEAVRALFSTLAPGSVNAVTRQSDLSVLLVGSFGRNALPRQTPHFTACGQESQVRVQAPARARPVQV